MLIKYVPDPTAIARCTAPHRTVTYHDHEHAMANNHLESGLWQARKSKSTSRQTTKCRG